MWTLKAEKGGMGGLVVNCMTLDNISERLGRPDVIKVDTEGNEAEVLQSGEHTLRSMPIIFYESDSVDVAKMTLPAGYGVKRLDSRHWLMEAKRGPVVSPSPKSIVRPYVTSV
jgi:hypothetical protein